MTKLFIYFSFLLLPINLFAQKTYYYEFKKIIHDKKQSAGVSGGQFITFMSDICYESNKKGIGVGHGMLRRNKRLSNSSTVIYNGKSYWDNATTFKFTSDLMSLTVITQNGDEYSYKQAVAPTNVTTCSLIRKKNASGSSSNSSYGGTVTNVPTQPILNTGGGTSSPSSTTPGKSTPVKVWHECGLCHGKGTIVRESNVPTYGTDSQWYCSQCGRNVWKSSGHSHVTCQQCYGKGGYYTTQ